MIETTDIECVQQVRKLRRLVQRLALMSHAATAAYGGSSRSTDDDIGGRRPTGGTDFKGDREPEYRQRTAGYFQRKLDRLVRSERVYGATDIGQLVAEAEAAVLAWLKTPDVAGVQELEPKKGEFLWKCMIADDDRPIETVKAFYGVHKSTVYRYRATYRGLRKSSIRRAS